MPLVLVLVLVLSLVLVTVLALVLILPNRSSLKELLLAYIYSEVCLPITLQRWLCALNCRFLCSLGLRNEYSTKTHHLTSRTIPQDTILTQFRPIPVYLRQQIVLLLFSAILYTTSSGNSKLKFSIEFRSYKNPESSERHPESFHKTPYRPHEPRVHARARARAPALEDGPKMGPN
jgi:hypothetical protein